MTVGIYDSLEVQLWSPLHTCAHTHTRNEGYRLSQVLIDGWSSNFTALHIIDASDFCLLVTADRFLVLFLEIEKTQKDEGKEEEKFIDVVINKNMKLGQKVLIPVKQFPKVSVSAPPTPPPETLARNVTHTDEGLEMLLFIDNESTPLALLFDLNHLQQPLDTLC